MSRSASDLRIASVLESHSRIGWTVSKESIRSILDPRLEWFNGLHVFDHKVLNIDFKGLFFFCKNIGINFH